MKSILINAFIASVLAGIRIAGHKSEAFQAIAHLYVGGLFAWSICRHGFIKKTDAVDLESAVLFSIGVAVSLIELAVALWQRFAQ